MPGEDETLRERIAGVLADLHPDLAAIHPTTQVDYGLYADSVIQALSLDQVGWHKPGRTMEYVHTEDEHRTAIANGFVDHGGCVPVYRLGGQ